MAKKALDSGQKNEIKISKAGGKIKSQPDTDKNAEKRLAEQLKKLSTAKKAKTQAEAPDPMKNKDYQPQDPGQML